ncbi:MAG TPA: phytoene desaturase family protein [Chloroflexota bacterium]|nr:phytoene desaturase family protein [Chloroflexota bacterium]
MRVAVVGAGLGGLALAIRLQAAGHQVAIFEARSQPGGRAGQIVDSGYVFDTGPSVVTLPDLIRELFVLAGRRLEDEIELVPLDPFYRLHFADGEHFDYGGDPERMKVEIARFSQADATQYDAFFRHAGNIYQRAVVELGDKPFLRFGDFARIVPSMLGLRALRPVASTVAAYFKEPHVFRAFSFQPLFIGGNPFTVPSIYAMFPFLERTGGVHFFMGGMFRLVQALAGLFESLGGDLRLGCPVRRIVVRHARAAGVETDAGFEPAEAVVSNADVAHTRSELLGQPVSRRWRWSMSCFLLFLGTNRVFPKLRHHTIVFSERYRELVGDIIDRQILPADFSMYVHAPARTDPSMAPAGGDSIYLLVPVPNLAAGVDWQAEAPRFRDRLLEFLERDFGLEGLRESIVVEHALTPDAYFRDELRSTLGNAFQLQPLLTQSAYFRPHCVHQSVRGLYLVGAGAHPGPGVPGVLLSARMVAGLIGHGPA